MGKLAITTGLCIAAAIISHAALAADQDYEPVNELESFAAHLIGPKIMDPEDSANYFVILPDGAIEGTWYGNTLTGTWRWEDGYFCRALTAPRPAPEDCQEWSVANDRAKLVRNRGAGDATIYALGE
ncbi:MAG: hypothetical protein HKO95_11210 [Rhodobacteraceae bacterium]|nr:hypothetical protein [Paracoccaceae bacterium]